MHIGDTIRYLRESHGLSQVELGEIAGVSDKAVSTWENNLKFPRMGPIERMAKYFGISKSDIIEGTVLQRAHSLNEVSTHPDILPFTTCRVPLLGDVACGEPIYSPDDGFSIAFTADNEIQCDFALRCKGDSMINARIYDGDIVFIRKQDSIEDGEIAAVSLDGEATLKRIYRLADGRIELRAENPKYKSIIVGGDNETRTFYVMGKAVAFQSVVY